MTRAGLLCFALLAACGVEDAGALLDPAAGDGGQGDVATVDAAGTADAAIADAGIPIEVAALAARIAAAECAYLSRCREAAFAEIERTGTCDAEELDVWIERLGRKAREGATLGELEGQATACLDDLAAVACWVEPAEVGAPCFVLAHGELADGEGCVDRSDCRSGTCSSDDPTLACGECLALGAVGDACGTPTMPLCSPDLVCSGEYGGRSHCTPAIRLGEPCGSQTQSECATLLHCFGSPTGVCAGWTDLGGDCGPDGHGATCPASRMLTCIAERCVRAAYVGVGEICDLTHWCDPKVGLYCDRDVGRCLSFEASIGELCDRSSCGANGRCAADAEGYHRHCVPRRGPGEPCHTSDECQAPLECLGEPKICQPYEWRLCRP